MRRVKRYHYHSRSLPSPFRRMTRAVRPREECFDKEFSASRDRPAANMKGDMAGRRRMGGKGETSCKVVKSLGKRRERKSSGSLLEISSGNGRGGGREWVKVCGLRRRRPGAISPFWLE